MGRTHHPNTSEYTAPHKSESCEGKTHVDIIHYGSNGHKEGMTHSTNEDDIAYGEQSAEYIKSQR